MFVAILGRQNKIALAELEAVFGASKVKLLGNQAALVEAETLPIVRFGGSIRFAKHLVELENHDFPKSMNYITANLAKHLEQFETRKVPIGISAFGFRVKGRDVAKAALGLKLKFKNSDKSLRILENKKPELNTAQVRRNKLISKGLELLLISNGRSVALAQTSDIQDIDAYAARDQSRPKRDAKVGMLPPKLAQIMLNLACSPGHSPKVIADIYCGTGVVLQEARLMGMDTFGSDLSERMIDYTTGNMNWLDESHAPAGKMLDLEAVDATKVQLPDNIDAVVSEMYLGEPLHLPPNHQKLAELKSENQKLLLDTLKNLANQLNANAAVVLAIPAWREGRTYTSVLDDPNTLEQIRNMGYNLPKFKNLKHSDLLYFREDQVVARRLLVLRRD